MKKNKILIICISLCILLLGGVLGYYIYSKNTSTPPKSQAGQNKGTGKNNTPETVGVGANPKSSLTPTPSDGFSFAIQADSHLDENTDSSLYKSTLTNIVSQKPSFLMDLGDTFMSEKFAKTQEEVEERVKEAKGYFNILDNIPLHLVNGNHDGEAGWSKEMMTWSRDLRLKYFPSSAEKLKAYSGNQTSSNYYSFVEGDAQFIVLDPFTYSDKKAKNDADGWNYTLGLTQYNWLKSTLENSTSKYKFVFIHNLVGGYGKDERGGAEASKFFEWGGYSSDGGYDFEKMRPDFEKPIHNLLVDNKVSAVFHGHDHFYGKQTLDGVIYQLVPQPGTPGNSVNDASKYSYTEGVFLPSAGYLRVTVNKEKAIVEYVKTENPSYDVTIPDSYTISPN